MTLLQKQTALRGQTQSGKKGGDSYGQTATII